MSILIKIQKNVDSSQHYQKALKYGQNFWKSQFWSKFTKISKLVKIVEKNLKFGQTSQKFSILVQIVEKCWFGSKLTKMLILVIIAKNVDFSQNCRKISILIKICKYLDFGQNFRKISMLVKNVENLDFDDFREISNLVKIFEQSRSWPKWSKILDFGQNLPKCRFWSKLEEILILIQIFEEYWLR